MEHDYNFYVDLPWTLDLAVLVGIVLSCVWIAKFFPDPLDISEQDIEDD